MSPRRARICKICFGVSFALGLFCFLMILFEGVMPHAMLDVVLSREELSDQKVCDKTLKILMQGAAPFKILWGFAGVVTTLASGVGLWAASERLDPKKALPSWEREL